jgi:hypothetical protein
MNRVLCIHPRNDYNIGDLLTYYGGISLIKQAFTDVEMLQFDIRRAEEEIDTYVSQYNWGNDINMIMLAGTPWLGIHHGTPKVQMVEKAIERWPHALKIALGIGAILSPQRIDEWDVEEVCLDYFRAFDLVITRDRYANKILEDAGIRNHYGFDTGSFFKCKKTKVTTSSNILVFYDPFKNHVTPYFEGGVWKTYINFQLQWARTHNADIIAVTSGDQGSLESRGMTSKLVTDIEWLSGVYSKAPAVLSGRVHQALLAKISGCKDVKLIPVDSRHASVSDMGIEFCYPVPNIIPSLSADVKPRIGKKEIVKLLRELV